MLTPAPVGSNLVPFLAARRPAIHLDSVSVRLGRRVVLREVECAFPQGSVTAIVGPSGAGKSTLIGVLNGLIAPIEGTVHVEGFGRLDAPETLREHRRQTATVFQEHALIGRVSALDNVLLGLADQRHPLSPLPWGRDLRRRAALSLAHVGLLHRAYDRVDRLSGGERQRVGFARALVRKPRILLADEPFSAVDPALVRHLGNTLRRAVLDDGATLIIVLHQIEIARALANRILGLANGRLCFDGLPRDFDAAAQARLFHPPSTTQEKKGCFHA